MSSCVVCFLRRFRFPNQINSGQGYACPSDLAAELEDSRKFSLNMLTALLAILTISGSKALQPVVLTLLMYTITLRLALNNCFLRDYPAVAKFLHVMPLLGLSCVVCVELILGMQSPALATVCIFLGVLPLVTIVVHHGRQCAEGAEVSAVELVPERTEHVPALGVAGPAGTTPMSNRAERAGRGISSNPC